MSRGRDSHAKVYVGDLPRDASDKDLEKVFREYGRIKSVWVARNPPGFAFVEFENPRDASDAVNELDGTVICGVRTRVEISSGRSRPKPWVRGRGYGGRGGRYGGRDGGYGGGGGGRRGPGGDDRCYECGERGHFAYECNQRRGGRGRDRRDSRDGHRYRRSRSRSRSA